MKYATATRHLDLCFDMKKIKGTNFMNIKRVMLALLKICSGSQDIKDLLVDIPTEVPENSYSKPYSCI